MRTNDLKEDLEIVFKGHPLLEKVYGLYRVNWLPRTIDLLWNIKKKFISFYQENPFFVFMRFPSLRYQLCSLIVFKGKSRWVCWLFHQIWTQYRVSPDSRLLFFCPCSSSWCWFCSGSRYLRYSLYQRTWFIPEFSSKGDLQCSRRLTFYSTL